MFEMPLEKKHQDHPDYMENYLYAQKFTHKTFEEYPKGIMVKIVPQEDKTKFYCVVSYATNKENFANPIYFNQNRNEFRNQLLSTLAYFQNAFDSASGLISHFAVSRIA